MQRPTLSKIFRGRKVWLSLGLGAVGILSAIVGCMENGNPIRDDRRTELSTAFATVPAQFQEFTVASNLASPTAMAIAPDGRVFFCEQAGRLRVVKNDTLLPTAFLTLTVNSDGERGLIGVAFDPAFASNRYIYVYHTVPSPLHNQVSRFTASAADPNVVQAGSESIIFDLDGLSTATNHNGGAIHFGPDGKLYIAVGENANPPNAQDMGTVLGKMLRINADGSIPTDNPFYNSASGKNRAIWALGLRNPFTFSFQPGTGRMFINDVGEYDWEEIDQGAAGANYGWPTTEGATTDPRFVGPLLTWNHADPICAIVGSAFYNPATAQFPSDYVGSYFYGDYCAGWIRRMNPADKSVSTFATGIASLTDIKIAEDGSLYYITWGATGSLRKIIYSSTQGAYISQQPSNQTTQPGNTATFTVTGGGTGPLTYQWQRDKADISGAVSSSYTTPTLTLPDSGAKFRCVITNTYGNATSNEAVLNVVSNRPPTGVITAPRPDSLYQAGQTVAYAGTGTDPEDGALPDSAFTWLIVFHHETHTHPFLGPFKGKSGSFVLPTQGESSPVVWYRIHLTVVDKGGLSQETIQDVNLVKADVTLATVPAGLQVTLDGQPSTAPLTFTGVAGFDRTVNVTSPQALNGKNYQFASWSDAGAAGHNIKTPAKAMTLTATFSEIVPPTPPNITVQPKNVITAVNASTGFSVTATGTAPLTYQWQRNDADMSGAAAMAATLNIASVLAADDGAHFRCIVGNAAGKDTSDEASLTLAADKPPVAAILTPASGAAYSGGQAFSYSGTGTDPDDGDLPASAFAWNVTLYKANLPATVLVNVGNAKSGSFTIPVSGETSGDVFYRVTLIVQDKEGLKDTATTDLSPVKALITLTTNPAGLQFRLDGQTMTGPITFTGVAGIQRVLEAVTPQTFNGKNWEFTTWSDAGAPKHNLTTPAAATTFTANFREIAPTGIFRPTAP